MHNEYYGSVVDGKEVDKSRVEVFPSIDPATGKQIAEIHRGNLETVNSAVESSSLAGKVWSEMDGGERGRIMLKIAEGIEANFDKLAYLESIDNGKPLFEAEADIKLTATYYRYYAGLADKIHGETIPLGNHAHSYTRFEPYGVTLHIVPWNAALQQSARGVAPAIAGGNTAIIKPAEDTSMAVVEFAKIAFEAGLPEGVINVVTGYGKEVGELLSRHKGVRKVAFTGSVATGREIIKASSENVIPVTLELGGKSPNNIFSDSDSHEAAVYSLKTINFNAGQVCMSGSRLLVQRDIHDSFVDKLAQANKKVRLGRGLDNPDMGPITTELQFKKIQDYLKIGMDEGAEALTGGRVANVQGMENGRFIEPTIFINAHNDMRIAQEEIFGPVLTVIPFDTEEEAVQIANDIPYGLAAAVWTNDLGRAHRVAASLDAGQIAINDNFINNFKSPFGGFKNSGFGREKGPEAIYHYLQTKTIGIRIRS